jgi:hypothetical protein
MGRWRRKIQARSLGEEEGLTTKNTRSTTGRGGILTTDEHGFELQQKGTKK